MGSKEMRMGEEQVERRLAAILAADVVGYSRLMEANEERTLGALRHHRREFFEPTVAKHDGRIFKVMGDGFLVEFGSVLSATRCAVELQRGMLERNAGVPEDRHIKFRIGVNLGDIIVDGDDFYGDGVNIAARLQEMAEPDGICITGSVHEQVVKKLMLAYDDLGALVVKNMERPLHVFRIRVSTCARAGSVGAHVPARPSIAVLPFTNMSGDPVQQYFSDGITEDIITDLSKVSGLFVLNRNTVFSRREKAANTTSIARDLGVAYVVQGSVRKAGNQVRINAQLIEGATDRHVWADRYDRELTDIFAIQDEITKAIVEQLKVRLLPEEKKAIEQAPTADVEAYTHYLRGRQFFHMGTKSSMTLGRRMFARAADLDPRFARAYAGMAYCDSRLCFRYGASISADEILNSARKALAIDPDLAEAHAALGYALMISDHRAEAASTFERAIALGPNCYEANELYAEFCFTGGDFDRAARHFLRAMEIQPDDYQTAFYLTQVFVSLGRPEEAARYARLGLKRAEEALRLHPESSRPAQQGAAALAFLGERDRALEWLERSLAIDPDDAVGYYNAACTYSLLGEADRAIDLLEISLQQFAPERRLWIEKDSDLDPIRTHPRYRSLLQLARSPATSDLGQVGS
jgi:adenylate cyclase